MDPRTMAALFAKVAELRPRDLWTRGELEAHQTTALRQIRDFAYQHSPFYAQQHAGLEDRPLAELPVVTKSMLMEPFDKAVTDRAIHLPDVRAHLAAAKSGERFRGRFCLCATSGSTGEPGIFLFDPSEWTTVLASFARGHEWAGVQVSLTHRMKMASVASTTPWHMSSQAAETLRSWWMPALRLAASDPVAELVQALNDWQPEMLVTYASMARLLADEQRAGRLAIMPHLVFTSSEVLTDGIRRHVAEAWGSEPFNEYAATETGGLAAECDQRHGLHLFEDLVIVEVVDGDNQPVPPGEFGERLLLTSLFNRTVPLIRYVLSDSLRLATDPCSCGRPFTLVEAVQGREEEVLVFRSASGALVEVHPNVFHGLMDAARATGWQVVQESDRVLLLLAGEADEAGDSRLAEAVHQALVARDVPESHVVVRRLPAIPRGAGGKAPLIRRGAGPLGKAEPHEHPSSEVVRQTTLPPTTPES